MAGHADDQWPDLLREYVTAPAGIEDAPTWDRQYFGNGRFAYDYPGDGLTECVADSRTTAECTSRRLAPEFPGLGGAIGSSPLQLATFAHALLSARLVSGASLAEMTRSHGGTDGFGGMDWLGGYAQGMWHAGQGVTHSIGLQGYYPWLDQSDADPANHLFGVFAQDAEPAFHFSLQLGIGFGVPLSVGTLVASVWVLCRMRQQRLRGAKAQEVSNPSAVQMHAAA